MIILLCGYAGSGKNTVADLLIKQGFKQFALADNLRKLIYDLDVAFQVGANNTAFVKAVVDVLGWEKAKREYPELRSLLQRTGDVVKKHLGQDVWAEAVIDDIFQLEYGTDENVVISDVRYKHEVEQFNIYYACSDLKVVWIERENVEPANDHLSEHDMKDYNFDWTLTNNGDFSRLEDSVDEMLSSFEKENSPNFQLEPFCSHCDGLCYCGEVDSNLVY